MTIGINANWLIYEKAGIGKYSYYLIREILRQDKNNDFILLANFWRHYAQRKKILDDLISQSGNRRTKIYISCLPSAWRDYLTQTGLPLRWLYPVNLDLYFSTYFSGIAKNGFARQMVVIYDLAFLKYPEQAGKKLSNYYLRRTKMAADNSQKIIAISHSTKNDLVKLLSIEPEKIVVIYPGVDKDIFHRHRDYAGIVKKYHLTKPFVLSVGTLEPRKNLPRLLQAWRRLPARLRRTHQLVLVGGQGWNDREIYDNLGGFAPGEVVLTGYVPDKELPLFYSAAKLFVYSSLYEGFGLPVLEAMSCGCPAVISDTSSLPEVGGSAADYINPLDTDSLVQTISRLLSQPLQLRRMAVAGLKQAGQFSWDKCGRETLKVYERLAL